MAYNGGAGAESVMARKWPAAANNGVKAGENGRNGNKRKRRISYGGIKHQRRSLSAKISRRNGVSEMAGGEKQPRQIAANGKAGESWRYLW
jgi:hypothetical protein